AEMGHVLRDRMALGFSALIALYVAVEVAIYVWMPTYLEGYEGAQGWLSTWALTLFFVLRAVGRFIGSWLLERVRWTGALLVMGAAICACFVGALLGGLRVGVWLLPATGLFMSIVYPTLNSKAISCFPRHQHGAAAGVLLGFTALAAAVGPLLMGLVSDHFGSPRAGFVLATAFSGLLLLGLLFNALRDPAGDRLRLADEGARAAG
ncbi:MFS transporter, partial [bacterium]